MIAAWRNMKSIFRCKGKGRFEEIKWTVEW